MNEAITWIYQAEDMDPAEVADFEHSITSRYVALAEPRGFDFRTLPATELIASCVDGPVLRHGEENLLDRRQCFIVEDASTSPQGTRALRSIYRTVQASDSVLLNRSFTGADYLERDKLAMQLHAAGLGVPAMRTVAVPAGRFARRAVAEVTRALGPGPYIVKPQEMSMGIGVLRVESDQQLATGLDIAAQTGAGYVVQPMLEHAGDMRVYVADGEVVSSLTRRPRPNGYLASISQGGSLEVTGDHRLVADHCKRIAHSLDAEWLCVDWLMTASGPVLNEWSTAHGGFTLLPEPERTLVADAFFGWIKRKFDESAPSGKRTP